MTIGEEIIRDSVNMPDGLQKADVIVGGRYAKYSLGVFLVVYILNYIDRQMLSILAEEIKMDLGISDAQMGFLFGTVFAIFYATMGIPLGKLADVWSRKKLISIGIAVWSIMTALSGTAKSFAALTVYRTGVAVGEASASPAVLSMLSDLFPPRLRATVFAIYSSGVYIGGGIGIFLGGMVVNAWHGAYPDPSLAPFGLKAWQVAFLVVGTPGLLVALWVATLREPRRGISDGIETPEEPHPFRIAFNELLTIVPPFTLFSAARLGAGSLLYNLLGAAIVSAVVGLLTYSLGNPVQWMVLGLGGYATFSWAQSLKHKDAVAFALIFRSKAIIYSALGFSTITFVTFSFIFWTPPFFLRNHQVDIAELGVIFGLASAIGGMIGITMGGWVSDWARRHTVNARLYCGIAVPLLSIPIGIVALTTSDLWVAYFFIFLFNITAPMSIGPSLSTVNDLVIPRLRAVVSAFYYLLIAFIGLAMGPFFVGQVSDKLAATGMDSGKALGYGMIASLLIFIVSTVFLLLASKHLRRDEESLVERARAAGEVFV